jgi:hypothetical protein
MIVPLLLPLLEGGAGEAVILGVPEVPVELLGFVEPESTGDGAPLGLITVCVVQQFGH